MFRSGKRKEVLFGAIVGCVLGAVSALLLAPKSGRELRADIANQYQNLSEHSQQLAQSIGTQTGSFVEKAKEAAHGITFWKADSQHSVEESNMAAEDELVKV
jgi:gas vesicle protein